MYDFAHCLSDYIEGITHSICTLEFEVHRPLYDWLLEHLDLTGAQVTGDPDVDLEPPRGRAVVVLDVDLHSGERPLLRARVHHERGRDAGGERGRKELVRRRATAVAADARRLVGDEVMAAVDQDLLTERPRHRVGCCVQGHGVSPWLG